MEREGRERGGGRGEEEERENIMIHKYTTTNKV